MEDIYINEARTRDELIEVIEHLKVELEQEVNKRQEILDDINNLYLKYD